MSRLWKGSLVNYSYQSKIGRSFKRNMRNKIQHTHIFSGLFTKSPQLGNIPSRIYVGIAHIATVWTKKVLAIPVTNHLANVTDFAGITRVSYNKGDASKFGFVFKKGAELSKSPRVMSSSLCFSNFSSFPNIGQVLNGNSLTFRLRFLYDSLTDCVIDKSGVSLFSAFKPFQELFASSRAFALNGFTSLKIFVSDLVQLIGAEICSIRKGCDLVYSKIHSYKLLNIFNIFFRNFNSLEKIKFTLFINKICFAFNVRQIFRVMADKGYFKPAVDRPDRDNLFLNIIGKNTRVISNCTEWLKYSLSFLVKFIGVNYFTYTSNKHLSRKPSSVFKRMINKVVNLELIENLFLPYHIGNLVTGTIGFFKSCQERFSLFIIRKKFYLQCKFHNCNIHQTLEYVKRNLLQKKGMGNSSPTKQSLDWGLLAQLR